MCIRTRNRLREFKGHDNIFIKRKKLQNIALIEFISEVRVINREESRTVTFTLGDMIFEYDERKNEYNIEHHGISFKQAARVFFDYDRIELYDEENSEVEDRYDTIGDLRWDMGGLLQEKL